MKKILLFIAISFLYLLINSSTIICPKCKCLVILIPKQIYVPIFNSPNGNIKDSLINDTISEDYYIIEIKKIKGDYSFISASTAIMNIEKTGWIENKYLGIYSNVYSDSTLLYSFPTRKSKISSKIYVPAFQSLNVINCSNGWLLVNFNNNNKITGWLPPENQCSNPYSTCN